MNKHTPLIALLALAPLAAPAGTGDRYAGERPPLTVGSSATYTTSPAPAPQRLYAPGENLVAPAKAAEIVDSFKAAYTRLGSPRMVIVVNRELVEPGAGLRLTGRKERVEGERTEYSGDLTATSPAAAAPSSQVNVAVGGGSAGAGSSGRMPLAKGSANTRTEKVTADNTYEARTTAAPTLADRQTVRDIERLFGRPLRIGGARIADQRMVAQLVADRPMDHFLAATDEAGRKDREALAKIADVVVEVLISSRPLTLAGLSGDQTYQVPDIQVTAVRLSDGAILGQAAATDVLGRDRDAGPVVRAFDVNDIAEATALALMEDMTVTAP